MGLRVSDVALEADLSRGLIEVESALQSAVHSADDFVEKAGRHLVAAGGKRFRPMLVLLAAQYGDPSASGVVPSAVVVELTHVATLYHDDVMDEAPRRRGIVSANARWDNSVAILTGDYLFAKASDILADLGPDAVRLQARTFERLCVGQIRETVGPRDGQSPVEHHLAVLADKTGSLIATSARFGAMMAGADQGVVTTLAQFGERIGVAFQIADDIVDIVSESRESGKTPGTDLREGVPTLAALYVLEDDRAQDSELRSLLTRALPDDEEHAWALAQLRDHEALARARAEARRWADEARAALAPLPDIAATRALYELCDRVVDRTA